MQMKKNTLHYINNNMLIITIFIAVNIFLFQFQA